MIKLPAFESGVPLADHVSSERMNDLVAAIRSGRAIAGRGLSAIETSDGVTISITRDRGGPGLDVPAYVMGSTEKGSDATDISEQSAPQTDKTLPHLDTWDITNPPYTYGVSPSDKYPTVGVKFCPIRVHIVAGAGVSYVQYMFTRTILADSKGNITYVSKETLVSKEFASGSGSSGGGV